MYRCSFPLMYFLPPESHTFHCDGGRAQRFQTDSQRPALDRQGLDMLSYFGDKLVEMQNYYILGWQHHCCSELLDLHFLTEKSFPRNPWKHRGELEEGGLCTLGFYLFHPIVQHTVSQWVVLELEPNPIIWLEIGDNVMWQGLVMQCVGVASWKSESHCLTTTLLRRKLLCAQ